MKRTLLLISFIFLKSFAFPNVGITAPSLSITTCTFPSTYSTLGDIVIDEGANGDFAVGVAQTLILTAPTNFEFNPGIGILSQNGGAVNLAGLIILIEATKITITYTCGGTNRDDILTISGVQVRGITAASSGNILRTVGDPGSGSIAGITNGLSSFGSLTSSVACGCLHTVRLTDTYGDGWNGGTAKIQVNGVDVLTNLTIASGYGPADFTFLASTSDVIRVIETNAGSYPTEMRAQVFDGSGTSIIAIHDPTTGAGTSGTGNCPPPMSLTAASVVQSSSATTARCGLNQVIVCLQITTTGVTSPYTVTQIQTNFAGSAGVSALSNADIYYTGTSATFSATTLFGSNASPSSSTYNINGSQNLTTGINHFWLVYDLNNSGTIGTTIDGLITQFTASATNYNSGSTPNISTTNPAGTSTLTICTAPGGIYTGLETWVKADAGIVNQSASGTSITANGSPSINSAATTYNYNPYIDFTAPVGTLSNGAAANRQFLKISGYNDISAVNFASLFFTFNLTDLTRANTHVGTVEGITYSGGPANGTLHGGTNAGTASMHESAYDPTDFGLGSALGTWKRNSTSIGSDAVHSSVKHILSANCTTGGNTGLNRFLGGQIDQADPNAFAGHFRDWKGPCSEIIGFSNALTATERQKVHSYLAIKYGVTLAEDYLSTSGTTIFTTAAPYNLNVIGIGRDDTEALNQKQSHQDDDTVRIYMNAVAATNIANAGSFSSDISYVVQGSDNRKLCTTASAMTEIPSGLTNCAITSRLEREWKVKRTNMAQNYNMDVKLSSLGAPGSVNVAYLRLLVDDDGNFGNGGTQCYYNGDGTGLVFTYSNPTITISNISTTHLPNNTSRFITIASINPATPLPIEIIYFDAKLNEKKTVDLRWETLSERDNDYFTIDKSTDGVNWEYLGTVDGSGTTVIPQSYYLEDKNPSWGINYYRLKQTDFNGQSNHIDIKTVELKIETQILAYPNPANNKVELIGEDIATKDLEITNNLGQKVPFEKKIISSNYIEISTEHLANGIYYVSFANESLLNVQKLIITHLTW